MWSCLTRWYFWRWHRCAASQPLCFYYIWRVRKSSEKSLFLSFGTWVAGSPTFWIFGLLRLWVHRLSMHDAILKNWIAWVCHAVWWPLPPPLAQTDVYWEAFHLFFSPPSLPWAFKYKILIRNTDRAGAWSTALHLSQGKSKKEGERETLPFSSLCSPHLCLPPFLSERRTWAAGAILLCTEKQLGSILDEWGVH